LVVVLEQDLPLVEPPGRPGMSAVVTARSTKDEEVALTSGGSGIRIHGGSPLTAGIGTALANCPEGLAGVLIPRCYL
jgi:hypothetical protein